MHDEFTCIIFRLTWGVALHAAFEMFFRRVVFVNCGQLTFFWATEDMATNKCYNLRFLMTFHLRFSPPFVVCYGQFIGNNVFIIYNFIDQRNAFSSTRKLILMSKRATKMPKKPSVFCIYFYDRTWKLCTLYSLSQIPQWWSNFMAHCICTL